MSAAACVWRWRALPSSPTLRSWGKNAACLLTISDSFVSPEITTAEQRQTSFTNMMKVALGAEY